MRLRENTGTHIDRYIQRGRERKGGKKEREREKVRRERERERGWRIDRNKEITF